MSVQEISDALDSVAQNTGDIITKLGTASTALDAIVDIISKLKAGQLDQATIDALTVKAQAAKGSVDAAETAVDNIASKEDEIVKANTTTI